MFSKGFLKKARRFSLRESNSAPSGIEFLADESPWKKRHEIPLSRFEPADTRNPLAIKRHSLGDRSLHPDNNEAAESKEPKKVMFIDDVDEESVEAISHENKTFSADEAPPSEFFVAAFASQGRGIGELEDAKDICIMHDNIILTSDMVNSRLQTFTATGRTVGIISEDDIEEPWGVAITPDKNIAVTMCRKKCVVIIDEDGNVSNVFGESAFKRPTGIAVDSLGRFIICDSKSAKVYIYSKDCVFIRELLNPAKGEDTFSSPRYVCINSADDIIISDSGDHSIKVFNSDGIFIKSFGSGFGSDRTQFKCPYGVATDSLDNIFVADHYNKRISVFTKNGAFIRHIVTSEHGLIHPQGLAISGHFLYVTHGHLKANEVLIYKFNNTGYCSFREDAMEFLTHI